MIALSMIIVKHTRNTSYISSITPRIDMVFDVYLQSRGISPAMIVKGNTKVRSWKRFLKNDANKQSPFTFIAKYAQSMVLDPSQQLVVTCRDGVLTNPESWTILEDLSPL